VVATRRPIAGFAVGIAAVSLVGLPPTGGFVAKWYLVVASISTGQWWWAATIVVGSLLTAAYLARLLQRSFAAVPLDAASPHPRGRAPDVIALTLASAGLLLGLYPNGLLRLLEVGAPLGGVAHG
jgi:multicomponent Na+:H+ antiporter subunit D